MKTAKQAIRRLCELEALHCGPGADDPIVGFPCLVEVIDALMLDLKLNTSDIWDEVRSNDH